MWPADVYVLAGRIRYFGYPEVQLNTPIDFTLDPHTGARWPAVHGKRTDYRHAAVGDPKWIWELNRCQFLTLLIEAWCLSGQDPYARGAIDIGLRWAEQNPVGRGIAWANGYEPGLRAISLALMVDALRGSGLVTEAEERQYLEMLWQHARWIRRDPSTHSSANNHRMGELVGLIAICLLAPELRAASRWLSEAFADWANQATRQILPDGVGAEMAFTYHLHVVDL